MIPDVSLFATKTSTFTSMTCAAEFNLQPGQLPQPMARMVQSANTPCHADFGMNERERERNVLFNDALNTFYLRLYGVRYMVKDIVIVRKETRCRHIGYSYRLTARVLLYAPSHRQDNTYHGLCYTSRGALAGTRNWHE